MATDVAIPSTLTSGFPQDAQLLMADLNALRIWLTVNATQLDGSKEMSGILSGPNTDPSSANQYTRKSWVDTADKGKPRVGFVGNNGAGQSVAAFESKTLFITTEVSDSNGYHTGTDTVVVVPSGLDGIYLVAVEAHTTVLQMSVSLDINGWASGVQTMRMNNAGTLAMGQTVRLVKLSYNDTVSVTITSGAFSGTVVASVVLLRLSV